MLIIRRFNTPLFVNFLTGSLFFFAHKKKYMTYELKKCPKTQGKLLKN
jgi:hypothetical protein